MRQYAVCKLSGVEALPVGIKPLMDSDDPEDPVLGSDQLDG
ncbi:hypothetical protein [Polynucleobacter sp. MWH-Braz-FAM2G]|nr:hypothetical protein [Polynucleobacter sp. MWH-Braz-FAM2G]